MLNSARAGDNCSIYGGLCQSWLFVFFCRFFTSAGSGCSVSSTCSAVEQVFGPKRNVVAECYKFRSRAQKADEY